MKSILGLFFVVVGINVGFCQGQINFLNTSSVFINPTQGPARPVTTVGMQHLGFADGAGLTGTNFLAQLYLASDGADVLIEGPSRFRIPETLYPGTWNGGIRNFLPAFQRGMTLNLVVRVWDGGPTGTLSFGQAQASGMIIGQSSPFSYFIPLAPYTPDDLTMYNFQSFIIRPIPEPTTFALGLMGLGVFLFVRRRH